jgi:hypothetical protein
MLEAFGLTWLAGVLSSVLSDALKERLKPATAEEKARQRAYALFTALGSVTRTTDLFVSSLVRYAALVESGVPEGAARLSEYRSPSPAARWAKEVPLDAAISQRDEQFRRLVARPSEADSEVVRAQAALYASARDLREALEQLEQPLKDLDPQLAVHQPDVSDAIDLYRHSRGMLLLRLEELAWHAPLESVAELQTIVDQAQRNQRVIHQAIDEFRAFLAGEFSFKESF